MAKNLWKQEELCLFDTGMTINQIAEKTGRSINAVRTKRVRMGFVVFNGEPWTTTDLKYFVKSYGFLPVKEIASNLGRSVSACYHRASEMKLTRSYRRGNHGNQS